MEESNSGRVSAADAGSRAEALVRRAFEGGGWQVLAEPQVGTVRPDLIVSRGPHRYVVEIKAVPRGSSVPLEDYWSRACLQAKHAARNQWSPLAIVVAPQVSAGAVERLASFAARYAPEVALGVMDWLGVREFRGAGLESLRAEPDSLQGPLPKRLASPKNLFSDLNQWLLKVLLAPELPATLIGGPRGEYRNASALAEAAGCSVMSAHRFVEELRSDGFLDEGERRLRLVQRGELFRRWVNVRSHSLPDVPLRMMIKRDLRGQIEKYFPQRRACLGLFAAADELGLGFVSGVPPYVLVDRPSVLPGGSEAMAATRDLMAVIDGGPADLIVRIPKAMKSVFRAMVSPKGVPCCDIIQVWLDVSNHGSRGAEQAAMIWRKHLRDSLGVSDDG